MVASSGRVMAMVQAVSVMPYPSETVAPKQIRRNSKTSVDIGEAPVLMNLVSPAGRQRLVPMRAVIAVRSKPQQLDLALCLHPTAVCVCAVVLLIQTAGPQQQL